MPVESSPPLIAVSGVFGIRIPGVGLGDLAYAVGSVSGRELDKFARYGMQARPGTVSGVPLIETGCAAWLECRLIPKPHTEVAYDTCFAQVVAAAADPRIFSNGRWDFREDNAQLHTLHHLCGGSFMHSGGVVRASAGSATLG